MIVTRHQRILGSAIAIGYSLFGLRDVTTTTLTTFDPFASLGYFAIEIASWLPLLLAISALILLWRRQPARLSLWTLSFLWGQTGVLYAADVGIDRDFWSSLIYPAAQMLLSLSCVIYLVAVVQRPPTSWLREVALPLIAIIVVFVPQISGVGSYIQLTVIDVVTFSFVVAYDLISAREKDSRPSVP